jgi:signal transduction histidine kinase
MGWAAGTAQAELLTTVPAGEMIVAPSGAEVELRPAREVSRLAREEHQRGLVVKFQGVVTSLLAGLRAFVIEADDDTAIFVRDVARTNALPQLGEQLEVQGAIEGGVIALRSYRRLGLGQLPEPAVASWAQMMNGSLDMRNAEIRGVIESIQPRNNGWSRVQFRTQSGVVRLELRRAGIQPGPLEQFEGALLRLRGKVFVDRYPDGRVKVGQLRLHDVDVVVEQPAAADDFAGPVTAVAALLRADAEYHPFRRVLVAGQIVFIRGWDYFLMDGEQGLRFVTSQPLGLAVGDRVAVAGFPELSGAAPVLRSAMVRKQGHAALPPPRVLTPDDLIQSRLDATRVQVDGRLASIRQTQTNLVMEIQSGSWRFLTRLKLGHDTLQAPALGSELRLTGVYCAQGGYKALGEDVAAVDLLLNSPADIQVLATPPWWTLPRLLVVAGVLAFLLLATVLRVTQLQRRVAQHTAELQTQILRRERAEHQRALAQERARIAHDLHDELGADITELGMLATRVNAAATGPGEARQCLDQLADKSSQMVGTLEEIVWATNPAHDSLAAVLNYFSFHADRFLGLAGIKVQWATPPGVAETVVAARARHQLFLGFKEALTNVVKHSGASEVRLRVRTESGRLHVVVADNGRGLPAENPSPGHDGINSMRARMQKLGGQFEISSAPGRGTTVSFALPLNELNP